MPLLARSSPQLMRPPTHRSKRHVAPRVLRAALWSPRGAPSPLGCPEVATPWLALRCLPNGAASTASYLAAQVERLFGSLLVNAKRHSFATDGMVPAGAAGRGAAETTVSLVEAKRANNIEITLARLRVPDAKLIEALRDPAAHPLTDEQLAAVVLVQARPLP